MKTSLFRLVLVLFFSVCAHAAESNATDTSRPSIATQVVAKKQTVRLGDPIIVSVSASNQAPQVKEMDRSPTEFNSFEVTDPDGKTLPYVGAVYQVLDGKVDVQPHSTVTITEALDLTDKYLFQKTGRYTIRFRGGAGLSESPTIAIEVTAGRLSEIDELFVSLLPVCHDGWRLSKNGQEPTGTPVGPGIALNFYRNPIGGNTVDLWLTKEEGKVDPNKQLRGKIVYLGQARGRFVHALVGENALASWPTAIEDISRALGITKQ